MVESDGGGQRERGIFLKATTQLDGHEGVEAEVEEAELRVEEGGRGVSEDGGGVFEDESEQATRAVGRGERE